MAMIRKASAVRKKLHMLIYGEQGTGKVSYCYAAVLFEECRR